MSSRWDNVLSGWRLATGCLQMPARVAAHVPQAKLAENIGSLFGLLAWAPEHPVGEAGTELVNLRSSCRKVESDDHR